MNEIQQTLDAIQNNGSWLEAGMYAVIVIVVCSVAAAIFRSGMAFLLGVVFAYYAFTLNTPDEALAKATLASQQLVTDLAQMGDCAAQQVQTARELGKALANGDIVDIAMQCGLITGE